MAAAATGPSDGILIGDKIYSGVLISLENCLIPDDKCAFTPSIVDGLDNDTETDLRSVGCELIQSAGILLRLPQVRVEQGAGDVWDGRAVRDWVVVSALMLRPTPAGKPALECLRDNGGGSQVM